MARALKFNLERRVKLMEQALALRQWDITQLDRLPRLLAQSGYNSRNNDSTRLTKDNNDDLVPSGLISQARTHTVTELGFSWNLLDFGMGHYNNLQQAERFGVAVERRRKAMHQLMQDVRVAFWRTASAQQVQARVAQTIALADEALKDARTVEAARIRNPVESLRFQQQLLENIRLLESITQELSAANLELASLINAPLNLPLRVVEPPDTGLHNDWIQTPVESLEEMAMQHNPDIRLQHHQARDARIEARKTLLRLFPSLSFQYNLQHDNDSYLVNNRWNQAGLQLSFNLINLLAYPQQKQLGEVAVSLADQRRLTAQAAVLTQVHLSRLQLSHALQQLERAHQIQETSQRLADIIASRQSVQLQSKFERVSSDTNAILSMLRRYQALSAAQIAQARLAATLGSEAEIPSVDETPLTQLINLMSSQPQPGHKSPMVPSMGNRP